MHLYANLSLTRCHCGQKPDIEVSFFPRPRCWQRPERTGAWEEGQCGDEWRGYLSFMISFVFTSCVSYIIVYMLNIYIHPINYGKRFCLYILYTWLHMYLIPISNKSIYCKLLSYTTLHGPDYMVVMFLKVEQLTDWQRKVPQGKGDF